MGVRSCRPRPRVSIHRWRDRHTVFAKSLHESLNAGRKAAVMGKYRTRGRKLQRAVARGGVATGVRHEQWPLGSAARDHMRTTGVKMTPRGRRYEARQLA